MKAELHRVDAGAGWKIALWRYEGGEQPVIMCHGLLANRFSLDLNDKYSLARYLSKKKFDVWLLELRGRGRGYKRSYSPFTQPFKYDWTFDTYVEQDVPSAINYVKNICKKDIFWIGHSMGGMLAYAYANDFKGVVTIGSPAKFDETMKNLMELNKYLPFNLYQFAKTYLLLKGHAFWLPLFAGSVADADLIDEETKKKIIDILVNEENVYEDVLNEFLIKAGDVTSTKVLSQLLFCAEINELCKYPRFPVMCKRFLKYPVLRKIFCSGSYDLKRFTAPILFVAGDKDKLAPPSAVKYAYENVSSKDKEYIELEGYGHCDKIIGKNAPDEVYKSIYEWLVEHV